MTKKEIARVWSCGRVIDSCYDVDHGVVVVQYRGRQYAVTVRSLGGQWLPEDAYDLPLPLRTAHWVIPVSAAHPTRRRLLDLLTA